MTRRLLWRSLLRAPRRLVLEAIGIGFPVAMLAATLLFVDDAVQAMTPHALQPVQIEMRAVARSLDVDIAAVSGRLAAVPDVRLGEPFAAVKVVVAPGTSGQVSARLFAVDPAYLTHHPWLRVVAGDLGRGALLDQSLSGAPGFASAASVAIGLPGDAPELGLTLPVGGTIDLRQASTWFSIPYGEVQGDLVSVPRAIVIDYATFEREVLPTLRTWARSGGLPPFDPGSDELPPASLEVHVSIDHDAYPADPGQAAIWSGQMQRLLARQGPVIVADNTAEPLTASAEDATNAKILFLLLGIPGVLVAGALGLAGASTLVEAHRREEALLRIRGATGGQIAALATAQAAVAGIVGSVLGLLAAVLAVSVATGRPAWLSVPPDRLALSASLAVAAGALTTAVRVIRLRRASRQSDVLQRRLLERGWAPLWRRARLDLVAIVVGLAILAVNFVTGGLRQSPIEGPTLALSLYVLVAPIAIWLGGTLLLVRALLVLLAAWARPERARPLPSWTGASLRWLGRRPARTAVALVLASLAVAFATLVLTFGATYQTAREADARAAMGSDLRLTPADPRSSLPPLGPDVAAVSPVRLVPARVDTDRKTILAIDLESWSATVGTAPRMLAGRGPEALAEHPDGVLIDSEIAQSFEVGPGDRLPVTSFPDDFENASDLELLVVGVFAAFPPSFPPAEVVTTVGALPRASTVAPDFYLARVRTGVPAETVAAGLRDGPLAGTFGVATATAANERGLTALNLAGLSGIESIGAALMAAVGVAVLGAFLVLERRREFATLHTLGADARQILTGPALEGVVVVVGSIVIGLPVGVGLGLLAVRVLDLFFALPPPGITVPVPELLAIVLFLAIASAVALGGALIAVTRVRVASVLREL